MKRHGTHLRPAVGSRRMAAKDDVRRRLRAKAVGASVSDVGARLAAGKKGAGGCPGGRRRPEADVNKIGAGWWDEGGQGKCDPTQQLLKPNHLSLTRFRMRS